MRKSTADFDPPCKTQKLYLQKLKIQRYGTYKNLNKKEGKMDSIIRSTKTKELSLLTLISTLALVLMVLGMALTVDNVFAEEVYVGSPVLNSIYPESPTANSIFVINGSGFGTSGLVRFSGMRDAEIIKWSDTDILCIVPEAATSGLMHVESDQNGISSDLDLVLNEEVVPMREDDPAHGPKYYKVLSSGERRLVAETINGTTINYVGYPAKGYATIKEALMYAEAGHTIQLAGPDAEEDISVYQESGLIINKSITLSGDPSVEREEIVVDGSLFSFSGNETADMYRRGIDIPSPQFARIEVPVTIENFTIRGFNCDNGVRTNGGAFFIKRSYGPETVSLNNMEFYSNKSEKGGAIYSEGNLVVSNCYFEDNHGASSRGSTQCPFGGGAIYASRGTLAVSSSQFYLNSGWLIGGAIDARCPIVSVDYCLFNNNNAKNGAAINIGGNSGVSDAVITHSTFTNNTSKVSGASSIVSVSQSKNWVRYGPGNYRLVFYSRGSSLDMSRSIMHLNRTDDIRVDSNAYCQINESLVSSSVTGPGTITDNSIAGDPLFADPDNNDFRIGINSIAKTPDNPDIYWGSEGFFTPQPEAPAGLTATAVSYDQINLSWNSVSGATTYTVKRLNDDREFNDITSTSFENTGLTESTTYRYQVCANNDGGSSSYSATVSEATDPLPPATPTGLAATVISHDQINLSWNSVSGADSYTLKRNDIVICENITTTTHNDTGLTESTTYRYQVCANNDGGSSSYSATVSETTHDRVSRKPAIPTGFTGIALSHEEVKLSWDPVPNATSYTLKRIDDGMMREVTFASIFDPGLTPGTTYSYQVRANNGSGSSDWSIAISLTTLDPPPVTPTGLTAKALGQNAILIKWNPVPHAATYTIMRVGHGVVREIPFTGTVEFGLEAGTEYSYQVRANNATGSSDYSSPPVSATTMDPIPATPTGLTATTASESQISLSWDPVSGATSYTVMRVNDSETYEIASTSLENTGLTAGTEYSYQVRANNATGSSDYSSPPVSIRTMDPVPTTPTGLTATAISESQINLSWDAISGATSYTVIRVNDSTAYETTSTSLENTGLTAGTEYSYQVCANNHVGSSAWSGTVSTRTFNPPIPPPTNLTVDVWYTGFPGSYEATFDWVDNSSTEDWFIVEWSDNFGSSWRSKSVSRNITTHTVGIHNYFRKSFWFRVRAKEGFVMSEPSNIVYSEIGTGGHDGMELPERVEASAISSSQINLTWRYYGDVAEGFRIYRSTEENGTYVEIAEVSALGDLSYEDTGLSSDTRYWYKMRTFSGWYITTNMTNPESATTHR